MKKKFRIYLNYFDISFFPLLGFCICFPYSIPLSNFFLILSVISVFISNKNLSPLYHLKKHPILIAFFLLNILYAFWQGFSKKNNLNIEQYALLLVMPIVLHNVIIKKQLQSFIKVFFFCIIVSLIPAFLISIGCYLESKDYTEFLYKKLAGNIGFHVIEYSLFISISGLFFLHEYFNNHKKINLLLLIVCSLVIILLSVRSTIIIYFFVLITYLVINLIINRKYILAIGLPIIIISVSSIMVMEIPTLKSRFHRVLNSKNEMEKHNRLNGFSGRIFIWSKAIEIIDENLILGVGPKECQKQLNIRYSKDSLGETALKGNYNAHNQFIQSYLELGLLASLLLIVFFIRDFIISIRSKNMFFIGISVLIPVACLTESILEVHKGIILLSISNIIILNHEIFQMRNRF